jgi:hydrogenase maturation protease
MNRDLMRRIADAVLYEGYVLYPYRPSVTNRQRWTFGGLYPEAFCQDSTGSDSSFQQTECLIEGGLDTTIDITIRFLHLTQRTVGEIEPPLEAWPGQGEPTYRAVESLHIDDRLFHTWQEAEEREVSIPGLPLRDLASKPMCSTFVFTCMRWLETLVRNDGRIAGVLVRDRQAISGAVEVAAAEVAASLFKLSLRVRNETAWEQSSPRNHEEAVLRSLASTHSILQIHRGEFVSLLDPPGSCAAATTMCRNIGCWPVLVGARGEKSTMLSTPIILYDYPEIAAESPGNLFDGTEIDEILTLRVLTLTEEEKQAAAALDGRVRQLVARTDSLACDELLGLHGTMRKMQPLSGDDA